MLSRRLFLFAAAGSLNAEAVSNPAGCQTNAWQTPPEDFEAFLRVLAIIRRLGYEGFEANVRYVQGQADAIREARERIGKTGLRFLGSHTSMTAEFEDLERRIAISAAAGAERIVLSGQGLFENGRLDETRLNAKVAYLSRAGAHCRKQGLRLAYHNHQGEFQGGGAEMDELLKRTNPEDFSLMVDAGHAYLAGADVPAFFGRYHQRIDGLHIRDLKDGKQVPLGQGEFDLKSFATAVREAGWTGWLVIEEELRTTDFARAEKVVTADRQYLREVFGA